MDHDPWLVKEVQRLTSELHQLKQSLGVIERKFRLGLSDADSIIVIGDHEWGSFGRRVEDSRIEIIEQLNDFLDNEFNRQLHWSALRLLTASGVLTTELTSFHDRVTFISQHATEHRDDAQRLADWFTAELLPITDRISSRLVQMVSRVLDPHEWCLEGTVAAASGSQSGGVRLTMAFQPQTEERSRKQREREKRLARIRV
ncbi:MAG: hypothetical protein AAFN78_15425 [Pseudomonadota bacterium]